ncbi:MAG TPA: polysaccharide biosynthesis C-terminal domain-containing protein [Spirochaetota bacterium]|nr:polysaccharide biosynthesis C-terminal domain-containing protein [Spirochaetota bacterium]HOM38787.1 polysaccharide biosynthesis C-terminal domain-containing protein [Spirochaetota bacterium]HPQ49845.1 polysaccharide biosynthesis C-terminal domain-containing protein [Spirochaetota bacterium]
MESRKYKKLIFNTVIYGIGNITSRLIGVIMLPVYTRYLSQSDYGIIDLLTTTILLTMPIFSFNIIEAVFRFSLDNIPKEKVFSNSIFLAISGWIIMVFFYPFLRFIDFIRDYTVLFYLLFLLQSIESVIKQFSRGINLNKVYMISDILYTVVLTLTNILFIIILGTGINGYLISMILASFFDILYLSCKVGIKDKLSFNYIDRNIAKEMLIFSIPLIPNSLFSNMSNRYFILYYLGLAANGIYGVANKFPTLISLLHRIFFLSWQISAVEEYNSGDKDKFYTNIFNFFYFSMIIVVSLYITFNKLVIKLLVSQEFYIAWKYSPILFFAAIFLSFSGFLGTNYTASKNTKGALITTFLGAIINIILNFILIPSYGLYGSCFSTLISYFAIWIIRIFDTRKYVIINYSIIRIILSILVVSTQLYLHYLEINVYLIGAISFIILLILSWKYYMKLFNFLLIELKKKLNSV